MQSKPIHIEIPNEAYWRRQIRCQDGCPVHTDARGYVRAIAEGDYERAYLIARAPNPLASICGRVCGAPCEAACRRGDIDQPVAIRALKRFVTEQFGVESNKFEPIELLKRVFSAGRERVCKGEEDITSLRDLLRNLDIEAVEDHSVAIIGSGPAGLAAAHDLALLGCKVVVFEMEPIPAGMLAVGIPAYRLPRDLIRAEVAVIEALGVEFRCNTEVGKDITMEAIREEFDATLICVGAKKSRHLDIPGGQGTGIIGGVEMLRDIALGRDVHLGEKVVVIGGGNVAFDISRSVVRQGESDVSRSALRQAGVREVNMVSLESLEELPADDVEIIEGDEEGIIRYHRWGPKEILRDEDGRIMGIVFTKVTRVFDENGRFSPEFDKDTELTLKANTVIWSIGQQADISFLSEAKDVRRTERGMIECNQDELTTSATDVFVAGDIAYGPRLLIHAVASGKQAARSIYHYLTGKKLEASQTMLHLPIMDYEREADYEKVERVTIPTLSAEERIKSWDCQVEVGYGEQEAMCDAGRCLDCGVNTIFDGEKCILCGGCADVCPELCLRLVSVNSLDGGENFDALLANEFNDDDCNLVSAIIKDETKCIRCALCVERCPVGAITMDRMSFAANWSELKPV